MRYRLLMPVGLVSLLTMAPICSDSDYVILEESTSGLSEGDGLSSNNGIDTDSKFVEDSDGGLVDSEVEYIPDGFHAIIKGTVTVEMYTLDEHGEYIYISWEDAYDGEFIFGSNFVTAYTIDDEKLDYHTQTVISNPSSNGNSYELEVHSESASTVRVYAANDYWSDFIIGSGDPVGNYPDDISDPDPEDYYNVINGIDISVLVPYWDGSGSSSSGYYGYGGGGAGESCSDDETWTLLGDVTYTRSYAGGDAVVMLLDLENQGPYHYTWSTLSPNGGGAAGEYNMPFCNNYSEMNLVGAHDSNYNGLIDPAGDLWGVYVNDGIEANPIALQQEVTEADIQIPYGDYDGLDLTPFVRISGNVNTLVDLPKTTAVYVGALKYRPTSDTSVSDLASGYDYEAFSPSEVQAGGLQYEMIVPANTVTYLWAYADVDNDGRINEAGEPVSSAGDDENGRVATGENSWTYDFDLNVVE